MARGARKSGRSTGPIVTPLEDHVPVEFYAVGRSGWFESAWEPGALDDDQRIVVAEPGDVAPVKEFLDRLKIIGDDLETTGPYVAGDKGYSMNPINPDTRIVMQQLGNQDRAYLIEPELMEEFRHYLESADWLKLGHNFIYDFKWTLVKKKIHLQRMYCSMLSEQLLTAGLMGMKVGLSDSVRRRAPHWIINKAVRDMFVHLGHNISCPECRGTTKRITRKMAYYGARDIVLLFPLFREQVKELRHYKLENVAQIEYDIIPATAEMEIEGVDLSLPVMRQIIEYWSQREKDVAEEIFQLFGEERKEQGVEGEGLFTDLDAIFNLKSNAAKLAALEQIDIDLDNIKRDTLKEVTKDKDFSERQRKIAKLLAEFSNITKMTTTYGKNMVEKINPVTGRWHPRFKQLGSGEEEGRKSGGEDKSTIATGRFSSDAQQFPKPKELFATVKNPKEIEQVMAHFAAQIAAVSAKPQGVAA